MMAILRWRCVANAPRSVGRTIRPSTALLAFTPPVVTRGLLGHTSDMRRTPQHVFSAARHGTRIEVRRPDEREWVVVYWAKQTQAWVAWGDPDRRTMRFVMEWRECGLAGIGNPCSR